MRSLLLLILLPIIISASEASDWQRMLIAGYKLGSIEIIDRSGEVLWHMPEDGRVVDAWAMPDGSIVYTDAEHGVRRIRPDLATGGAEETWHYPAPEGAEIHSCQPLGADRFCIGVNHDDCAYVLEVDAASGEELVRIPVHGPGDAHHRFRVIRKTPTGTYLVTINGDAPKERERRAVEIDAAGTILREFPFGAGSWGALQLPNGNTLLSYGRHPNSGGRRVVEMDPAGTVVWELGSKDIPGFPISFATNVQRLPNGNTIVTCYGGVRGSETPNVFEVTPDKAVVWHTEAGKYQRVTNAMVLGLPLDQCWH